VVTVDGKPLDPRFDLKVFSRSGFEWTYAGDGPPPDCAGAAWRIFSAMNQQAIAATERFMRPGRRCARQCLAPHRRRDRCRPARVQLSMAKRKQKKSPGPTAPTA